MKPPRKAPVSAPIGEDFTYQEPVKLSGGTTVRQRMIPGQVRQRQIHR